MFDQAIIDAIKADCSARFPLEACGIVTAAGYEPQPNVHEEPEMNFRMPPEVAERIAAGEVLAIVHSHNEQGADHPSKMDQEQAIAMAMPWGLVLVRGGTASEPIWWGEGVEPPPLQPRDFRWGPSGTDGKGDCFALVRDWYRQHRGLQIDDVARAKDWEEDDPNLYIDGYLRHGFTRVNEEDIQPGDGVLMSIGSAKRCPNHAGIYLGGDIIFHHLTNRMAERSSFGFWRRSVVAILRPPEPTP